MTPARLQYLDELLQELGDEHDLSRYQRHCLAETRYVIQTIEVAERLKPLAAP